MTGRDQLYRDPRRQLVDFAFDQAVAAVFPDMIRRSVPAYETVIPMTGLLAARHLAGAGPAPLVVDGGAGSDAGISSRESGGERRDRADAATGGGPVRARYRPPAAGADALAAKAGDGFGLVFDLGCSLGATTLALLRQLGNRPCRIVAVDRSKPMLDRAAELVRDDRVEFRLEDLRETDVSGAGVILMNYVLQFVPPADRKGLLRRFRERMAPGGLLLLSEKIRFEDAADQAFFDEVHLDYKKANGYSDLEVSGKRTALEKVMIADSEDCHLERLRAAGFAPVRTWFRCLNWASFMAWA